MTRPVDEGQGGERPYVTVIVPNYNHDRFLPARLESIAAQTFTDVEVLLLDDASSDGSLRVLNDWQDRLGARLIVNDHNSGSPFTQWNRGVQEATGQYVWLAESDDVAKPDFLETLVRQLEADDDVRLACCLSERIDAEGRVIDFAIERVCPWDDSFVMSGTDLIRERLYIQNDIPSASAVVFRREAFLAAGLADVSYRLAGDWLQWMKLIAGGKIAYVNEVLSQTRISSQTQRVSLWTTGTPELEALRAQREIRDDVKIPATVRVAAVDRLTTSWLQHVRSARYRGPVLGHVKMLVGVAGAAARRVPGFMGRLVVALGIFCVKRVLFRKQLAMTEG